MVALVQQPAPGATEIALEQALAERLGLEVGDTVRLGAAPDSLPRLAVVAAIYEPRPDPAELSRQGRRMRMHLPDLAALLDAPDRVDRFGIGLVPGVNADSAAAVGWPEVTRRSEICTTFGASIPAARLLRDIDASARAASAVRRFMPRLRDARRAASRSTRSSGRRRRARTPGCD